MKRYNSRLQNFTMKRVNSDKNFRGGGGGKVYTNLIQECIHILEHFMYVDGTQTKIKCITLKRCLE